MDRSTSEAIHPISTIGRRSDNRGWSFADCLPFFKKSEGFEGEAGAARGRAGPLRTTRRGIQHPLARAFAEACQQWGLHYNADFNGGEDQSRGCPTDITTADNKRCSSSVAFLRPALSRPNLMVVTRALASRVIVEGEGCRRYEAIRRLIENHKPRPPKSCCGGHRLGTGCQQGNAVPACRYLQVSRHC